MLMDSWESGSNKSNQVRMNNGTEQKFLDARDLTTSSVCRTCATFAEFVVPIYSGDGLQNNLADKIKRHLPIQVQQSDDLPRVVCCQCASTLLAWHELMKCSVQADAALRAKIFPNERKTNSPDDTIKSNSSVEDDAQSEIMAEICRPLPQHNLACVYCASTHPLASYQEHLVVAHSDQLFHCEECNTFVDKKHFVLHLSFHAQQYTSKDIKKKRFKKKREEIVSQNPSPVPPTPRQCSSKAESKRLNQMEHINPHMVFKMKTSVQENEFSDHSDMDDFEPLPESLFEIIEDSLDSQHLEDNTTHTTDNQPHSDESKQSSQPEHNPLSNTASWLEKKYNLNNCSVVITPLNINNYTRRNIAIKNSNVIKNLALPANKTPPKTADASSRDNHFRGFSPVECRAASIHFYQFRHSLNNYL